MISVDGAKPDVETARPWSFSVIVVAGSNAGIPVRNKSGGSGILVLGKGSNRITNCYIGTDSNGTAASANQAHVRSRSSWTNFTSAQVRAPSA